MNNERVTRGHLGKLWGDDFKYLPYKKQPITNHEIETWRNMGYDYVKSFTGSMYDNRNPMPQWVRDIEGAFGLFNQSYTFYKMTTLEIMPIHSDHYRTYCKLNEVDPNEVYRVILMLEDWKPGHYFELDGVGYTNWKAGDWFKWHNDTPHAAANIGVEDRYTLQVTGQNIYSGQMNSLLCVNVPNVDTKQSSHLFFKYSIVPKIEDNLTRAFMVYMDNSSIKQLDDITHDINGKDILNKNGLHIYLYEPLCSYLNGAKVKYKHGTKHTQGFYSEFSHDIDFQQLRADELDSILDYITRNNLTNVTVHTCDYEVEKYYPYYNSKMNLVTDDLFLKTQENIQDLTNLANDNFTKKFMNLNWRYTKHRNLVATYLSTTDSNVSWYFKTTFDVLSQDLPFKLNEWHIKHPTQFRILKENTEYVNTNSPLIVDQFTSEAVWVNHPHLMNPWPNMAEYKPGMTPALFNGVKNTLEHYYSDIFVDVINETRFFQPTANFSEKVFQAMQYMKPFIVVAPPKTVEYIKSLGFKTFSDFWDESYDDEYDHSERLAKIFKLIDSLNERSIDDLKNIYNRMIPILEHNTALFTEKFANPGYRIKRN